MGFRFAQPKESGAAGIFADQEWKELYEPNSFGLLRPHARIDLNPGSGLKPVEISTNAFGMRMREINLEKPAHTLRIAVLGDSAAFGWLQPEEVSFPRQLEKILNADGKSKYEVLNFAVPGATTLHGLKQYESTVKQFKPDLLILAFGLCDSYESRLSEAELYSLLEIYSLLKPLSGFPRLWHDYSTIGYWAISRKLQRGLLAVEELYHERAKQGQWRMRAEPAEMKENLSKIIQQQQTQGGKVILVHLNLVNFGSESAFQELAQRWSVPWVNVRTLFDQLGGIEERKKHFELGLRPAGIEKVDSAPESRLLFRVFVPPEMTVSKTMYIVGNHPKLGNGVPNTVEMYDNKTHGDERAGDRVWSLEITCKPTDTITFGFTNSGPPGQWSTASNPRDNDEKNREHFEKVDANVSENSVSWASLVYIHGRIPYSHLLEPGDSTLPNELGQAAIAKRLARLVLDLLPSTAATVTRK